MRGVEFEDLTDEEVLEDLEDAIDTALKFCKLTKVIIRFLPGWVAEMMVHEVRAEYREQTNPLIAEATRRDILPDGFPMV